MFYMIQNVLDFNGISILVSVSFHVLVTLGHFVAILIVGVVVKHEFLKQKEKYFLIAL